MWLIPLLALACSPKEDPADSGAQDSADTDTDTDTGPAPVDGDADGWTVNDGDCDDTDPARYPGRGEECNGIDDNCDERVDEGFADRDVDGTPDCLDAEECDGVDNDGNGQVDEGSPDTDGDGTADCVDVEECDGVDNDGNGQVDEGFDADADGFASCDECDDTDATVYPGAAEPNDGLDHDCDGLADDGLWAAGDLTLVEVMYNPQDLGDDDGEWIELVNTSGRTLPLSGLTLWSGADSAVLVDAGTLAPDERIVIGSADQDWVDVVWDGLSLGNTADSVELYADTVALDGLSWDGGVTFPNEPGAALLLDPWYGTADENDDPANWCAATDPWLGLGATDAGSPGSANEPCSTIDHDADGQTGAEGDCDDASPDVYAGAADTWYDGVDTDCDGWSDYDADRDRFDATAYGGTDCDDATSAINPAADEVCDDADTDEDCNGSADDADAGVTDPATWYADTDADGYGDAATTAAYCDPPSGWSDSDEDCDDGSSSINPGQDEVCGNGVDDNCDDGANDCGPYGQQGVVSAGIALLGSASGDAAGTSVDFAGDIDGDGILDVITGANAADGGGSDAGAAYVVFGPFSEGSDLSDADILWNGAAASDAAGADVDGIGDFDGDGVGDLLVGAPGADTAATAAGAVYVLSGATRGSDSVSSALVILLGEARGDAAGSESLSLGDLDGDGYSEIAVGVSGNDDAGADAGSVYLFDGGFTGSVSLGTADAQILGEDAGDQAGASLARAGDLNGDGVGDLLIGAPYEDTGATDAGAVYVVYLPVSGSLDLSAADARIAGPRARQYLNASAGPGDLDGDGSDDVAVGSTEVAGRGGVYVFLSSPSGSLSVSTAEVSIVAGTAGDDAGTHLFGAGDMDGDGQRELWIGATGADTGGSETGGVFAWSSFTAGSYTLSDAPDAWLGGSMNDQLGSAFAAGQDIDGDGLDDGIIGHAADATTASGAGAAYVIFGGPGL